MEMSWESYWKVNPRPDADFYRWFASRDAQTQKEILKGAPPEVVARCTQPKGNEALDYWQSKSIQKPQKVVKLKRKSRHLWTWIIIGYGLIIVCCILPALLRMAK
jgi:hypothetical protein